MSLVTKTINKIIYLYRLHVRRDPFLREIKRWFKDNGDHTLRLDYELTPKSIVFDVGGYHGDFASDINKRYSCSVFVFEPVPEFYEKCIQRFKDNTKIKCLNYGLSSKEDWLDIGLAENASGFDSSINAIDKIKVQVRSITKCIQKFDINEIDLLKVNIEGGEFDLIPELIRSGDIKKIRYLQVQFHNFVPDADNLRNQIRSALNDTHLEMWNYDFVWESWQMRYKSKI